MGLLVFLWVYNKWPKENFKIISEKLPFNNTENKSQQETEIINPIFKLQEVHDLKQAKFITPHHSEKFETLQELKVNLTGTKIAFNSRYHLYVHTAILLNRHDGNCDIVELIFRDQKPVVWMRPAAQAVAECQCHMEADNRYLGSQTRGIDARKMIYRLCRLHGLTTRYNLT